MSIVRISKEADKKLGAYVACIIAKNATVVGGGKVERWKGGRYVRTFFIF